MSSSHAKRPVLRGVVHVTMKICPALPGLRDRRTFLVLREAIGAGNEKPGFRVVAFSVLSNHFHYVVEAQNSGAVSRGMQGLAIRVAKALNRHWKRRGRVFLERFHARAARGSSAIRRVLTYVLQNARKHRIRLPPLTPDPYSSAPWFRFWRERLVRPSTPAPVVEIQDPWLTAVVLGWRISLADVPSPNTG